jgi:hypothetical protein
MEYGPRNLATTYGAAEHHVVKIGAAKSTLILMVHPASFDCGLVDATRSPLQSGAPGISPIRHRNARVRTKAMHRLIENDLSLSTSNPRDDEALGRHIVLKLMSAPSQCLFLRGNTLIGSGTFALMRKLVDAHCDELGLPDTVRSSARSYSASLLNEALDSLFKQRQ